MLFNAKFSLYIYIKYIGFGFILIHGISIFVGYLMPNALYSLIYPIYMIFFCLAGFQGISTFVGLFNAKSHFYTYIKYVGFV